MIPLVVPSLPKLEDIECDLRDILSSGKLTNFGKYSRNLENELSKYTNTEYAISVSNATTGLMIALSILPKNSEVIVPSFTFLPTVQAIMWNNLKPKFVDIDPFTLNICTSEIESLIGEDTSAILAVNSFGNPADISMLEKISKKWNLKLFYDSAHALGAKYQGMPLGNNGTAEIFSLSATKLLPCGEGGMITTNDKLFYEELLNRRNYGFKYDSYDCVNIGANAKITEFSAILGIYGIKTLEERVSRRNEIATHYIERFNDVPGLEWQCVHKKNRSTYKDFVIKVNKDICNKDKFTFMNQLKEAGIESASYFSPCIHQMSYYRKVRKGILKNSENVEEVIISLPIYSSLTDENVKYISSTVRRLLTNKG